MSGKVQLEPHGKLWSLEKLKLIIEKVEELRKVSDIDNTRATVRSERNVHVAVNNLLEVYEDEKH